MKKGITVIALSVIILVMIILTTTVAISGANVVNNSKKVKFASELLFMKEAVDNYSSLNSGDLPLKENAITNANLPSGNYYEINMSMLGNIDTIYGRKLNGDSQDIYVYSKTNEEIYYLKGLSIGNTTYYYLNDELKQLINYEGNSVKGKDGIIFTPSTKEYTNQSIKTTVKIPNTYTGITVLSENSTISTFQNVDGYYVYEVNKSSNYDVTVTYTKDGQNSKQVYTVSNFDNTAPTITVTEEKAVLSNNESKNSLTISTSDNLSGVKKVMYEVDNVQKSYFETQNKGKIVANNNVIVDKYVSDVTFYIVDNAGNSTILHRTLSASATEKDYVKYGLVVLYDGKNNTGSSHDSSATSWVDLTGNGNNGKLYGSTWTQNALNIQSTGNDYINMGIQNYNNVTLEIAFKSTTLNSGETEYISNFEGCGYGLSYNSNGANHNEMWIYDENTSSYQGVTTNTVVAANQVYSLSGSYDGKVIKLFENNTKFTADYIGKIKLNPNMVMVAGMNPHEDGSYNGGQFYGEIYSIRLYDRALTDEEVRQNYLVDKVRFGI